MTFKVPNRLLFCGPTWVGSTARHRQEAFAALPGLEVHGLDSGGRVGRASLIERLRYRLRWPADRADFNRRILAEARCFHPDFVVIDSVPVVVPSTLRALRRVGVRVLAFYSPDDLSAPHIRTRQLAACEVFWDVVFTTKTFNLPELRARGVLRPLLVGKSYHPPIHRPWAATEVGPEFERFDAVLAATFEPEREALLRACAKRGLAVLVIGGGWEGIVLPSGCERRPNVWDESYARALHLGKVAFCPLRRLNRDRITARSIEIPGCGRPMVAEKTDEHDEHFVDGKEYAAYKGPVEAAEIAGALCAAVDRRRGLGMAGHKRCEDSGYSTFARAEWMFTRLCEIATAT